VGSEMCIRDSKFYDYYSAYGEYPQPAYSIREAIDGSINKAEDDLGQRNVEGVRSAIIEALAQIVR